MTNHAHKVLTLIGSIVEVDEELLEVWVERASINSVTVVLACDVALARSQVQRRDVVSTVTVLHLDGASTSGQGHELVAQANSHDRDRGLIHQATQVVDSVHAVGRVTGAIGDEDAIDLVGNLVDRVVVRQNRDRSSTADQAAQNVFLHSTVDQSNMEGRVGRRNNKGSFSAHPLDKVDLARVDETLVLVGIVLVTDRDPSQGRALLSQVGNDSTRVHARDGGHSLPGTPVAQALNGSPVAVLLGIVRDNDSGALDVRGLEVLEEVEFVADARGHTVVADKRLSEDENLATVGRIGHGLRVADEGRGEDGLARDVGVGAEGSSVEDRTVLVGQIVSSAEGCYRTSSRTRIVKVASRFSTGAVALALWLGAGISLPLLPARAVLLANRSWPKGRLRAAMAMPAAPGAEDLVAAMKTRENMSS